MSVKHIGMTALTAPPNRSRRLADVVSVIVKLIQESVVV